MVEKTITVRFDEEESLNQFVNMLAWMEFCGAIGHCTTFAVRMDGDGAVRPKFIFDSPEFQKSYEELRHGMTDTYRKVNHDLTVIPEVYIRML